MTANPMTIDPEPFRRAGAEVATEVELSSLMHYRIGGPADLLLTCNSLEALTGTMKLLAQQGIPWFTVGHGTNLLFTDQGFRGAVLTLGEGFSYINPIANPDEGQILRTGAATPKAEVVDYAARRGLDGLVFMAGIPGQMGGGAAMNAGTKYGSLSDAVTCIRTVDSQGNLHSLEGQDLSSGYRHSLIPEGHVAYEMDLKVSQGQADQLMARVREILGERGEKQPLHKPSCGSTFRNPEGHSAGRLIEASGLKGTRIGGAVISEKHANFILNEEGATASDVIGLIEQAKKIVMEKWNVALYEEVIIVGPKGPLTSHNHQAAES